MSLATRLEQTAQALNSAGKESRQKPISSVSSLAMLAGIAVVFTSLAQPTGPSTAPAETRVPIGTTTVGGGAPIQIPSDNVEITARDGRKAVFTVLGFTPQGVKVRRAGRQSIIVWDNLSWESTSMLTGQKLSYDRPGKDAQWLPTGEVGCSRSCRR